MFHKTYNAKHGEVERKWYVVDLEGQTLGRAASKIAKVLMGKHKPLYTPHVDTGDFVVVINADKVRLTGRKWAQKMYRWHTGFIGGLKERTAAQMRATHPERMIEWAVRGMLPKTRLGRKMLKKMKVYAGTEHPHTAQNPEKLDLSKI